MKLRRARYLFFSICLISGNAFSKDVIFIPSEFPAQANAVLIGGTNRSAEQAYCSGDYMGLELARRELGFSVCNSDEISREVLTGDQLTGIDALILVDDTHGINAVQRQLLADAIDYVNGQPQLIPFGVSLAGQRSLVGGTGVLPAGYRVVVVGEQLYRDFYKNIPGGDAAWRSRISAMYHFTDHPRVQISLASLNTPQAARPYFDKAVEEYENGHYETAYEYFAVLSRIPWLDPQASDYVRFNMVRSLWSAGNKYYVQSAFVRALELFEQLYTDPILVSLGRNDLNWNIAVCLMRLGRIDEAGERFAEYTEGLAIDSGLIVRPNGPLDSNLRSIPFTGN